FADKAKIERTYLGITVPAPARDVGSWRTAYGRHPVDRKKFSSNVARGKLAITDWEVVERLRGAALVPFSLHTGRTHQIRVHAADHHVPLLGDPVYGHARIAGVALSRQALHAATLAFDHPVTGTRMRFESPLPGDFAAALAALR